jgi:hypothetical protein
MSERPQLTYANVVAALALITTLGRRHGSSVHSSKRWGRIKQVAIPLACFSLLISIGAVGADAKSPRKDL